MIKLKLVYHGNVRKFQLPEENLLTNVQSLVSEMIQSKFIPILLYLDEDEDWITISTESDLFLCLQTIGTPKIYILHPNDMKTKDAKEPDDGRWVRYTGRNDAQPSVNAMEIDHNDVKADIPNSREDVAEDMPAAQENEANLASAVDWNVLVEDFLSRAWQPLQKLVNDVYDGVKEGKDVKTLVLNGISHSSFNDHIFIKKSAIDLEKMLGKVNHMSMYLLHAGKDGLQMAVPVLLRGYARMKAGESNGIGPVFPRMAAWFDGLANGQEATFDLGRVMRRMMCEQSGAAPEAKTEEVYAAAAGIVIHEGVTCDICKTVPIIGIRYKCMTCLDFDMCESCRSGNHPPEHPLITLQSPVPHKGYKLGGGHLEGATEFLMPAWKECKKRGQMPKPNAFDDKPSQQRGCHGHKRGPGFRGKGRRRHRGGSWRHGMPPFGHGRGMYGPPCIYRPTTLMNEDDLDDTDSSSTSSSSEDAGQKPEKKLSGKKLKKRLRKLKKTERKTHHKIGKLVQDKGKIERRINKLQRKERRIMTKIAMLAGNADVDMDELPQNNPGHDPNPNTRPFEHHLWRPCSNLRGNFPAPDPRSRIHNQPAPPVARNDAPISTEPTYKYAAQLQMLLEMGFVDITTCKKLLEEVNGDINQVAARIGSVPYI